MPRPRRRQRQHRSGAPTGTHGLCYAGRPLVLCISSRRISVPRRSRPRLRRQSASKSLLKSCNAVSLLLQTWSACAKLHLRGWVANGGRLEGKLLLAPVACTDDDAPDVEEATEGTLAFVPRHKVLVSGFRLRCRAFMLTYNSKAFRK